MRNQNCPVCEVPMTTLQVIGDGVDDVVLYKCSKCSKELFVGYFRFTPPAINGPKVETRGFGDARVSSPESSHRGGVW